MGENLRNRPTYGIFHEPQPISVFTDPNFLMMLHPTLFPYGRGGPGEKRSPIVSFEAWVKHCLQYYDRRFAVHKSFLFIVFGIYLYSLFLLFVLNIEFFFNIQQDIIQRKQVCSSVRLRMKLPAQRSLGSISSQDLLTVLKDFTNRQPGAQVNPAVTQLMQSVRMAGMKVMGSPCQKLSYRQQMLGMVSYYGAPALFITVNLSDLHDPKVCLYVYWLPFFNLT